LCFNKKLLKLINKDLMIFFRKMITRYHVFFGILWSSSARKKGGLWPLEGVLCMQAITCLEAAWASRFSSKCGNWPGEGVRIGPPHWSDGVCAHRARLSSKLDLFDVGEL
jgi:hypothetical protein